MPRAIWALVGGRPVVQVELHTAEGRTATRTLLADTGAGTLRSGFELLLRDEDCRLCGSRQMQSVCLRGAYEGEYWAYMLYVRIPMLGQNRYVRTLGVENVPPGLDGIACFRFLSQYAFGNLDGPNSFGLERLSPK